MNSDKMEKTISQLIVVEGLHDKQAVLAAVEADVWVVGGDRIAREMLHELRRAANHRGVIILTDPDGPGERIRRRIAEAVPHCQHAFVAQADARSPDGGRLGVEFATPETIKTALLQARAQNEPDTECGGDQDTFTYRDLELAHLVNHSQAALRRARVGEYLRLGYANGKSFLHKLNVLGVTRTEWEQALVRAFPEEQFILEKGSAQDSPTDGVSGNPQSN